MFVRIESDLKNALKIKNYEITKLGNIKKICHITMKNICMCKVKQEVNSLHSAMALCALTHHSSLQDLLGLHRGDLHISVLLRLCKREEVPVPEYLIVGVQLRYLC